VIELNSGEKLRVCKPRTGIMRLEIKREGSIDRERMVQEDPAREEFRSCNIRLE
jgi:hypothetical protein